jgi:Ca2+-binding RTX toxin-like protein
MNVTSQTIEILDAGGVVLASGGIGETESIEIVGAEDEDDQLTIDFQGGFFAVPNGISFDGGAGGTDSLAVVGVGVETVEYIPSGTTVGSGTMSATLGTQANVVFFTGLEPVVVNNLANVVFITPNDEDDVIVDAPGTEQNRISGTSGQVAFESLTFSDVSRIVIDTGVNDLTTGTDVVTVSPDGMIARGLSEFVVTTGAGDDKLAVNSADLRLPSADGTWIFDGGAGSDQITGRANVDFTLFNDRLVSSGGGHVILSNIDRASLVAASASANNVFDASNWTLGGVLLKGRLGNDLLLGSPGPDTLLGGSGDDCLVGGAGNDEMFGGGDNDVLDAGDGNDLLEVTGDLDSDGNDRPDNDLLFGGAGDDNILILRGVDTVMGGHLDDDAPDGDENYGVQAGSVGIIIDHGGMDTVRIDYVNSETGPPGGKIPINDDGGDDVIVAPPPAFFSAGVGFSSNPSPGATIILSESSGSVTGYFGTNVEITGRMEQAFGSAGDDIIIGNSIGNLLSGIIGNDTIVGNAGDDTMIGGTDDDRYVSVSSGAEHETDVIDDVDGTDTIDFSSALVGISIDLRGALGQKQRIDSTGKFIRLNGTIENALGTDFSDTIRGNEASNLIDGRAGDDLLDGEDGDDLVLGGLGRDILMGGNGDDILIGGAGNDRLTAHKGDNLLISGTTSYDNHEVALLAMLSEWSKDTSFDERFLALIDGIIASDGTTVYLKPRETVLDDEDIDTMIGGTGNNWLFVGLRDIIASPESFVTRL